MCLVRARSAASTRMSFGAVDPSTTAAWAELAGLAEAYTPDLRAQLTDP